MASDSQVTGDYVSVCRKVFQRRGALVGIAGELSAAMMFVDWYFNRNKTSPPRAEAGDEESKWYALVATRSRLEYWDHHLRGTEIHEPYAAIGSGAAYAVAAMDCGKSAAQAVRIAARRDPYTGGRIVTLRLPEAP